MLGAGVLMLAAELAIESARERRNKKKASETEK